jgi:hypothetical protein
MFWQIIDESRGRSAASKRDQPTELQAVLEERTPSEIIAFDEMFARLIELAFRWDLWGAAYVIQGGCGDDGFTDFCAGLIGLGRSVFEAALADPESLALLSGKGVVFSQERLLGAARKAYRIRDGREMPPRPTNAPTSPVGRRWDEDELPELYPRLHAAYAE